MDDTFIFRSEEGPETTGLLLPAVQSAREAARRAADADHKDWIDILSVGHATPRPTGDGGDGDGLPDRIIRDHGGDTDWEDRSVPSIADFDLG